MEPIKLVKHALDSSIALVKKGSAPTEALQKVAQELDLNKEYIQRTGEALNVALTYNHFKTGSNKADTFPIADIPHVIKTAFASDIVEKKASVVTSDLHNVNFNRRLTNPKIKQASAEILTNKKDNYSSYETTLKGQYKIASDYISRIEKELESMEVERVTKRAYLESAFNALTKEFKKTAAARIPFHDFESRTFAVYGERAVPYIDLIYKAAELKEERGAQEIKKLAEEGTERPFQIFSSLLKCAADMSALDKELEDARSFVAAARVTFKQAGLKLHHAERNSAVNECNELADKIAEQLEKEAKSQDLLSYLFNSYADAKKGSKSSTFKNTNIDNRERTMLLQELIMTDPILAHQDPKKILTAYTQILRLAPHLAKEKEVVRSLLRELTATQSLAPTEANQLVEANTNFLKQQQLMKSTSGGDKDKK